MVSDDEFEDVCAEKKQLEERLEECAEILAEVGWIPDTPSGKRAFIDGIRVPVRP